MNKIRLSVLATLLVGTSIFIQSADDRSYATTITINTMLHRMRTQKYDASFSSQAIINAEIVARGIKADEEAWAPGEEEYAVERAENPAYDIEHPYHEKLGSKERFSGTILTKVLNDDEAMHAVYKTVLNDNGQAEYQLTAFFDTYQPLAQEAFNEFLHTTNIPELLESSN